MKSKRTTKKIKVITKHTRVPVPTNKELTNNLIERHGTVKASVYVLTDLIERHGTDVLTVKASVYMTEPEAKQYLGERCKDYEPGCCVCKGWLKWDKSKKVKVLLNRSDVIRIANY